MDGRVTLTGHDLDPESLAAIARRGAAVEIDPSARARIEAARALVERAATEGRPVYGVTTGLGSRVGEPVPGVDGAAYSLRTLRGRAAAVGRPLDRELSRAAMAARLNGICVGGSGAGPAVADGLAALLNAGVHPSLPQSGSIGAADLVMLAYIGLVLIGEGEAEHGGEQMPAAAALSRAGLAPVTLGYKDGLAICSSSAVSVGTAALAMLDCESCLATAQVSAALSMEGFRSNLSPLDERVVAARAAPGQRWSAAGLRDLLADGSLIAHGAARRLQDPLSFRCASQIHGSLRTALDQLAVAIDADLNGAADNPLVLTADDEVLSTGNFHVPALALALDCAAIAVAQVAATVAERPARLRTEELSGLPKGLVRGDVTQAGVSALLKTAQALTLEIRHLAAPLAIHATVSAEGVEDDSTGAAQAALRLREQAQKLELLIALELLVAAQAVDIAAPPRLGRGTATAQRCVRELIEPLTDDRPLGPDVERIAHEALSSGELLARVQDGL
jgi:histidine ammonia-lyase